jgi:hypothetical protein
LSYGVKGTKSAASKKPVVQGRAAPVAVAHDDDAAFPRGGASTLTPLERRQIEAEAAQVLALEHGNQPDAAAGAAVKRKGGSQGAAEHAKVRPSSFL